MLWCARVRALVGAQVRAHRFHYTQSCDPSHIDSSREAFEVECRERCG